MDKSYNFKEIEIEILEFWKNNNYFNESQQEIKNTFSTLYPPPNVSGILHIGHTLNGTLQDILARFHRMQGCKIEWIPGIDHAGLSTQNVVSKKLAKEGIN